MKKKLMMPLLCLALGTLLFCACAAPATTLSTSQGEERVLSDVRVQYRNASLVVSGVSEGSHMDSTGALCYDISALEVFAGDAQVGDKIHCSSHAMQQGEQYLLFLSEGEDVHYAEDTLGYEVLSDTLMPIQDNEALLDGKRLSLDTLRKELEELGSIINAPAPVYYYDTVAGLAEAADEIFIGRVAAISPMENRDFSIRHGGSVEKVQYDAEIATVETYGAIKGAFSYGQRIELLLSPNRIVGMLDATTLQPMNYSAGDAARLQENGIYLFFLINGPDSKQPYFFTVNPIQGFASYVGEDIYANGYNKPLRAYSKMAPLVLDLQQALDRTAITEENPALIVEE